MWKPVSDNYRLAEHQVEMKIDVDTACDEIVKFMAVDADAPEFTSEYGWPQDKWTIAGEPETIYVTVTAVLPTSDPADEVEVFKSADSSALDPERNPSTTVAPA